MAKINNSYTFEEIRKAILFQGGKDILPTEISNNIVPVIEVNPKLLRTINIIKSATVNNATSGTVYSTPTDRDFYIVAMTISCAQDATATNTRTQIQATIDGANQAIGGRLSYVGLRADTQTTSIALPFPIKIDRGTNITLNNLSATANVTATCIIYGYETVY